jgi:hypothetical protein
VRWPFVIEFWTARIYADAALLSVMGTRPWLFAAQSARPVKVPSIEYLMIGDTEEENFNPILVQVDLWAPAAKAKQIEQRIHNLTHRNVSQDLGGEWVWLRKLDYRTGSYDGPEKGVIHRILDYEFKPVKQLA